MKQLIFGVIIFACLGLHLEMYGQKAGSKVKVYDVLNVIYVDNSQQGLSENLSAHLRSKIDSASALKNAKFLFYISNGRDHASCDKPNTCKQALNMLYDPMPLSQDLQDDKENMRKALFKDEFKVSNTINVSFYLSEKTLRDLDSRQEPSYLVNMFPQEIAYLSSLQNGTLNITIYHAEDIKNNPENIKKLYAANAQPVETKIHFVNIK